MTKYVTYTITIKEKDLDDFHGYIDNAPFWIEYGWLKEFEGSEGIDYEWLKECQRSEEQ